jgi:hypothetical protein
LVRALPCHGRGCGFESRHSRRMRTVQQIYDEHRIMRNLQLHQLRVGAVARLITAHFKVELDSLSVVTAALFHDMGNIVKFDLGVFPESLEPEGRHYWEEVKREFIAKYGAESHAANLAIARELGLSETVCMLIDSVSFSKLPETLEKGSAEQQIVEYCDTRVGPYGILSIRERFLDGAERYAYRYPDREAALKRYEEFTKIDEEIERRIFSRCDISPSDITDLAIAPIVEELKHFQVQ